jgi:hypothetical protein
MRHIASTPNFASLGHCKRENIVPYQLVWHQHYVIRRFTRNMSINEMSAVVNEMMAHPQFRHVTHVISDCRDIGDELIQTVDLLQFVNFRQWALSINPRIRYILVSSDPTMEATVASFRRLDPDHRFAVAVVQTMEDALKLVPRRSPK